MGFQTVQVLRPFLVAGRMRMPGEVVSLRDLAARSKVLSGMARPIQGLAVSSKQPARAHPAETRERKVVAPPEANSEPPELQPGEPDQCLGITKAGTRCRVTGVRVVDGYCHHHQREGS